MVVYTAESQTNRLPEIIRSMIGGLRGTSYTSYRLFLKDVKSDYAKSKFGLIWDFIDPLVFAGIFYTLQKVGILSGGNVGMSYAVFVVYGFLLYQTFRESVLSPLKIMRSSRPILTHLKLPPECLLMSIFFRGIFNGGIRAIIMLGFSLVLGDFSLPGFILFVILFPTIILVGMSIGIFLAPFNTVYNDVGRVTEIMLNPLRFGTPVMYSLDQFPLINTINPITQILDNLRSLATSCTITDPGLTAGKLTGFVVLMLVGWFIFHVSIPVLAERA